MSAPARAPAGETREAFRPASTPATSATSGMDAGAAMHGLMAELYPICRSITGDGVRATLRRIAELIPLEVREVPSGTRVFDWTVPHEWNVRDAYVKDARGERVIDFRRHSLHLVSYSVPVRRRMSLAELRPHLHTLPDRPDAIPYRTAYYDESWGFCLAHRDLLALEEGTYEVCVDTTREAGHLTYGECVLPGETDDEVLLSCHCCHPSLCNDNLSGVVLGVQLARHLAALPWRRYTYRVLFAPVTIGAITWLCVNEARASRIRHGLVLSGVGDPGGLTYKRSRRGVAAIDRAVEHVLAHAGRPYRVVDFSPYGYDERQYGSPGFDLPVGCLMRTPHGEYPEYHTSADDLAFVRPDALAASFATAVRVLDVLERDRRLRNVDGRGEPQLGRRGLYPTGPNARERLMALLWTLNLSDGEHSLLDVAARAGVPFHEIADMAAMLVAHGLLAEPTETP